MFLTWTGVHAAAVAVAFLIVNPLVNMPFDDDWSYSFTVRQLLATGLSSSMTKPRT